MAAGPPRRCSGSQASVWPYFPATRVTGTAVAHEVFTGGDEQLRNSLVPAARNLHAALAQLGMDMYVRVSTESSLAGGNNDEVDLAVPAFRGRLAMPRCPVPWTVASTPA
ncbi:putative O-glycosyl hydrolase family 17 protein precursor [Panicum miliaceum]|uniref:O-glycosyl hydrolase family 17 protein n=1 Tax=Panicum miliaceum TaxID=4540 RepID=A0A3L6S3J6_PANMI|nr:putative O-glycosyl hydrolase family 17 protein precursor [Panicum miliaceum]